MKRIISLPGLAVLLAACGGGGEEPPAAKLVQLPAGDVVLAPPATVYSLGAENGPEWQSFAHVSHVAFDANDNLYVLDRGVGKVFVYDTAGTFIREFGRSGQGPGELTFPLQLAVTPEGTVVVSDMRRRSFSMFDDSGAYVEEIPYEYRRALGGMEVRPHPRAGFVSVYQPNPGMKPDTSYMRLVWHSLDIDEEPRVLAAVRADPERLGAGTAAPDQAAFSHGFYWGVLPSGQAAVAHTRGYRIDVFSPEGTPERTIERPIQPRRTTAADREAERERRMGHLLEDAASLPPSVRKAAAKQMEELRFAETMPVIQEFGVDPFGRMWVRRGKTPAGEGGRVDVISAEGTYLGTFPAARVPLAFSRSGLLAYMEQDELDVQHVVVRRAPQNWGAIASR